MKELLYSGKIKSNDELTFFIENSTDNYSGFNNGDDCHVFAYNTKEGLVEICPKTYINNSQTVYQSGNYKMSSNDTHLYFTPFFGHLNKNPNTYAEMQRDYIEMFLYNYKVSLFNKTITIESLCKQGHDLIFYNETTSYVDFLNEGLFVMGCFEWNHEIHQIVCEFDVIDFYISTSTNQFVKDIRIYVRDIELY